MDLMLECILNPFVVAMNKEYCKTEEIINIFISTIEFTAELSLCL